MSNDQTFIADKFSPYGPITDELLAKLKNIKLFISDVDGVLSDGFIYLTNSGDEIKSFNVRDGAGIVAISKFAGIEFGVITGRTSQIVENRLKSLGSKHIYQGVTDKVPYMHKIVSDLGLTTKNVAYIGDDVIDIPVFKEAGLSIAPLDAHPFVLQSADYICHYPGGKGAVREVCDLLLWINGKLANFGASI